MWELHVPTPVDFQGMAVLQSKAFHPPHEWTCRPRNYPQATHHIRNYYGTYQRYFRDCPRKLDMCRIIKSPNDSTVILAACQLMTRRDPKQKDRVIVFVEWIACLPDHQGQGIGSQLLAWAAAFSKEEMNVTVLSLFVIQSNTRARRLYERKGFVILGRRPIWSYLNMPTQRRRRKVKVSEGVVSKLFQTFLGCRFDTGASKKCKRTWWTSQWPRLPT